MVNTAPKRIVILDRKDSMMYQVTKERAQQLLSNEPHRFCPVSKKKLRKAIKDHLLQAALEEKLEREKEFAPTKRQYIKDKFSIREEMMYKVDFKEEEITGEELLDMLMTMRIDVINSKKERIANQISNPKEPIKKTLGELLQD